MNLVERSHVVTSMQLTWQIGYEQGRVALGNAYEINSNTKDKGLEQLLNAQMSVPGRGSHSHNSHFWYRVCCERVTRRYYVY